MKKLLAVSLVSATLVGCSGGGNGGGAPGGTTPGGSTLPSYTHNELASKFVQQLNLDADFDVTLVKDSTLQSDFIVIYDPLYDSYDAIDIIDYNPNYDNAVDYYNDYSGSGYYDLYKISGHYETELRYEIVGYDYDGYAVWGYEAYDTWIPTRYEDPSTGILFEKVSATPKDLAKISAIKEAATIKKSAQFLSSEFGLSLDRGQEVARLAAHWKKASKKGMTDLEQDNFATELLGFSITDGIQAASSGDASTLSELLDKAANANGITPEHAQKLLTKVFSI